MPGEEFDLLAIAWNKHLTKPLSRTDFPLTPWTQLSLTSQIIANPKSYILEIAKQQSSPLVSEGYLQRRQQNQLVAVQEWQRVHHRCAQAPAAGSCP